MRLLLGGPIRRGLARLGYTLVRTRSVAAPVTALESPTDAIYVQSDVVFEVPVSKCTHPYVFPYEPGRGNPFVETLREYGSGRHTRYEGSILNRYYEAFQPRTLLDVFFRDLGPGQSVPPNQLAEFTLDVYVPLFPWEPRPNAMREPRRPDPSPAYGPVSDVTGRLEFSRLTSVYDSIKKNGYRPAGGSDGEIRGFFLRRPGDYRFFPRDGFHRMAALSALGYDRVRVGFRPHHPRTVDLTDLENWPQVKDGFLDAEVAEVIFLRFFAECDDRRSQIGAGVARHQARREATGGG